MSFKATIQERYIKVGGHSYRQLFLFLPAELINGFVKGEVVSVSVNKKRLA